MRGTVKGSLPVVRIVGVCVAFVVLTCLIVVVFFATRWHSDAGVSGGPHPHGISPFLKSEWAHLVFAPLSSHADVKSAIDQFRLKLACPLDPQQEVALRATCSDLLQIQADWDVDGFVRFCQSRNMIVSENVYRDLRNELVSFRKKTFKGEKRNVPQEPIELFRFSCASSKNRPTGIAITAGYIAIAAKPEQLPHGKEPEPLLVEDLHLGVGGGSCAPYFVPKVLPEELEQRGEKVVYAEMCMIIKVKDGYCIPHQFSFYWDAMLKNWVPYGYTWSYPGSGIRLIF